MSPNYRFIGSIVPSYFPNWPTSYFEMKAIVGHFYIITKRVGRAVEKLAEKFVISAAMT